MAKMAGPFVPLPKEVIDLLDKESPASLKYYVTMLSKCFLETVEDTDTDWVGAYIHHTQRQIVRKLGGSGHLRKTIMPRWEVIGLLTKQNGSYYLPMYYRKGDAFIQPLRMQKEIGKQKATLGEMQKRQLEMEKTIGNLLDILSGSREVITIPRAGDRRETRPPPARNAAATGAASSLLGLDPKKISLSVMNKVISVFYKSVGQPRISGKVRGNAQKVFRSLISDGFSPYEIGFAVDWTLAPGNVTEKIRSFAILSNTISQALAHLEKIEQQAEHKELRALAEEDEHQTREREAAERERRDKLKASLSEADRAELRELALAELHAAGIYKEDMITEVLVGIQENSILRKSEASATDSEG